MDWMYCISKWMADYYHWWERRVQNRPGRWEAGLMTGGAILTFLPAFAGIWAFALWPIGWLCIPGLLAAQKKRKRANEIKAAQRDGALRTKKLIMRGQKEMKR